MFNRFAFLNGEGFLAELFLAGGLAYDSTIERQALTSASDRFGCQFPWQICLSLF